MYKRGFRHCDMMISAVENNALKKSHGNYLTKDRL